MHPQIFSETHPLEEVLVWGEPGIEALLGQLLPKSKSLFFSYYEVPEAREQFRHLQSLIEGEGVKVIRAKDAVARVLGNKNIENAPSNRIELESLLLQKADELYETYRQQKLADLEKEGIKNHIDEIYDQIKKDIIQVLEEDIQAYGEKSAVQLNYLLSLSNPLPLANIFYGRDQTQTLADRLVLSSLRWDIRRPEVAIFKEALTELGFGDSLLPIEKGTIEGGDIAILGDTCYIGVGARTNYRAVKDVCRKLGSLLESNGIQLVAVINKRHQEEAETYAIPTNEHMHIMHLDMFWIPLSNNLVMAYGDEMGQREVIRLSRNGDQLITEELGSLRVFHAGKGIEVIEVTKEEQENFATNLLNLGNGTLIVSLSKNKRVINELEKRGFRVLNAEITKLVGGYGAVHCLTAPIKRRHLQ
jgi:arginine deiminase